MKNILCLYLIMFHTKIILCVPPTTPDVLQEDVKNIKHSIRYLSVQMDKLNSLYLNNLEPKVALATTTLTAIDSNVHSLQERAHIWDTFQLHVASWNEQLSTVDRKLDIISKGQEKIIILDNKLNAVTEIGLEYKLENILKTLQETDNTLIELNKKITSLQVSPPTESLFGEYTSRGILSTMKIIERKLDRLQLNNINNQQTAIDDIKKLMKCSTSIVVEDILKDISSKIDVIFDKMSAKYERLEDLEDTEDYPNVQNDSPESDITLIKSVLKRITLPCKQTNKLLEAILYKTRVIDNNTLLIMEERQSQIHKLPDCTDGTKDIISNKFKEQRMFFESTVTNICDKSYWIKNSTMRNIYSESTEETISTDTKIDEDTTEAMPHVKVPICDTLELLNSTTIYEADLYSRHCIVNDHIWTVIQKRDAFSSNQNFSLGWDNYKSGFGDINKSFWLGNDVIHKITHENEVYLRIELTDFDGNLAWAEYSTFKVDSESNNYMLTIGGFKGNASDSLTSHNNSLFSTYDVKNDLAPICCPCAVTYGGGWWFNSCFESNLNGVYHNEPRLNEYFRGIIWETWLGNYSLQKTVMMIRKKSIDDNGIQIINDNEIEETSIAPVPEIPYYEDP